MSHCHVRLNTYCFGFVCVRYRQQQLLILIRVIIISIYFDTGMNYWISTNDPVVV